MSSSALTTWRIASLNQIGPSPDPDTAARPRSWTSPALLHRAGFHHVQRRFLAGRLPSEVLATRCGRKAHRARRGGDRC